MRNGMFIAFEGGEGAGKTTQARLLADRLRKVGHVVHLTREPGGTTVGSTIRDLLLSGENDPCPRAEALLYLADRAQHVVDVISPRLADGQVVISDRFALSTLVYQGIGRGLDVATLAEVNRWASLELQPDLTIVLDVNPVAGLVRVAERSGGRDRIELEPLEFHRRIRKAFLDLAEADRSAVVVPDGHTIEATAQMVNNAVEHVLLARIAAGPTKPVEVAG